MIKKKIVVASSNKGKIAEIKEILSNCEIINLNLFLEGSLIPL